MGIFSRLSSRRLRPRDELRRYMSPLRLKTTRRQMLKGLGLGAAAVGCSSESGSAAEADAESAAPGTTASGGAPAAGQGASPAQGNPSETVTGPGAGTSGAETSSPAAAASEPSGSAASGSGEPGATSAAAEPADSAPGQAPAADPGSSDPGNSDPGSGVQDDSAQELPADEPIAASPADELDPAEAEPEPSGVELVEAEPEAAGEPMGRSAFDIVELGTTGIQISRLAMGGGTFGYDGSSDQTRMGDAFTQLLVDGYDRGVRFYDTADAYGSHFATGDAMQRVGRQNVTLLTKTMAETRREAEADLDRFMEELQTDYLDIVLLHIRSSADWVGEAEGAMEVLAEAKASGRIRAHGVSCHSLVALELAARTEWVDVNLCRINPFQLHMDGTPETIIGVLEQMQAAGKGTVGMKILGQGDAVDRFDECIEHATRLNCINGFTIGFKSIAELEQVADKIARVTLA